MSARVAEATGVVMRRAEARETDTRHRRSPGQFVRRALSIIGLVGAVVVGLTAGGAGYEVDREADGVALPSGTEIQCRDLDAGSVLRATGVATGCAAAPDAQVSLVAVCNITNAQKRSPTALGSFRDGQFTTQPCAFGVRELFVEVNGVPTIFA
jgi:hypothetical protein